MNELLPFSPVPSSKQFARWFGSSKVTDAAGQPLAMYHGSACHFREFDAPKGDGIYFSSDAEYAAGYGEVQAECEAGPCGEVVEPVLYSVFLSIRRPLELNGENKEDWETYTRRGFDPQELGDYDGIVMRDADGEVEVMAFHPSQVWIVGKNGRPFKPDEDFSEPEYATLDEAVVKLRGV